MIFFNPFWQPLRIYIPQFLIWFKKTFFKSWGLKKIYTFITYWWSCQGEVLRFGNNFPPNKLHHETHKTRWQPTTIQNKLIILDIQNVKYFHLISFSVKEKKVKTVLFYTLMIFLHSNPFNRVEYEQFIETYRKYCSSKKTVGLQIKLWNRACNLYIRHF